MVVAAAAVSCSPGRNVVLPYPPLQSGDQTVIFAVERDQSVLDVEAEPLDVASTPLTVELAQVARGQRLIAEAIVYSDSLSDRRFSPGMVQAGTSALFLGQLAPHYRSFTADLGSSNPQWAETATASALAGFKFRDTRQMATNPCTDFVSVPVPVGPYGDVIFALEFGDGLSALFGTDDGSLGVIRDADNVVVMVRQADPKYFTGGFVAQNDDVFILANDWSVYRGQVKGSTMSLGFVSPSTSGPGLMQPYRVAGGEGPTGPELCAMARDGPAMFWAGGTWARFDFPLAASTDLEAGVAWVGPGECYFAEDGQASVVHLRRGVAPEIALEPVPEAMGGISGVASMPIAGRVACDTQGNAFQRDDQRAIWNLLGPSHLAGGICHLAPYKDGFVIGGQAGFVVEYVHGFCGGEKDLGAHNINGIISLGAGLLIAEEAEAEPDSMLRINVTLRKLHAAN
jgi:hypothetical protein